jgi:hypothetical protein
MHQNKSNNCAVFSLELLAQDPRFKARLQEKSILAHLPLFFSYPLTNRGPEVSFSDHSFFVV